MTNRELFENLSPQIKDFFPLDNPDSIVADNYEFNNSADRADIVFQWTKRAKKNYPELFIDMNENE